MAAQKRMFDKRITDSDRFVDLPNSTKALYFMAGMSADDRGFFQPRRLQKECGFTDDDYKILIAKNYFKTFESGVMVITDWNKNNYLDTNRLTETEYVDELKMLQVINGKYELTADTLVLNQCLTDVKPTFNQYSIVENSIDKNSSSVMQFYLNNINSTPVIKEIEILESYEKDLPQDLIVYAMEKAVEKKQRNLGYIKGILNSWISKGITTLSEAKEEKKEEPASNKYRAETGQYENLNQYYEDL